MLYEVITRWAENDPRLPDSLDEDHQLGGLLGADRLHGASDPAAVGAHRLDQTGGRRSCDPAERGLELLEGIRITSYNVCYTKLLRAGLSARGA